MHRKPFALLPLTAFFFFSPPQARADIKIEYATQLTIPKEGKDPEMSTGRFTLLCKGNKIRLESGDHVTISDLETGITYFFDKTDSTYRKTVRPKTSDTSKPSLLPMSLDVKGNLRPGADTSKLGKYSIQRSSGQLNLTLRGKAPATGDAKDAPTLPMKLALNFKSCKTFTTGAEVQKTGLLGILTHLTDGMEPPLGTMLGALLWKNPKVQTELGRVQGIPLTLQLELTPEKGTPQLLPAQQTLSYALQAGAISEATLPDTLFEVPAGRSLL